MENSEADNQKTLEQLVREDISSLIEKLDQERSLRKKIEKLQQEYYDLAEIEITAQKELIQLHNIMMQREQELIQLHNIRMQREQFHLHKEKDEMIQQHQTKDKDEVVITKGDS
ncbi:hypothetical protein ACSQ67_004469 [Phaseolus vulgaris]